LKLLLLCPCVPGRRAGSRIRLLHQIRFLGARHELTVVAMGAAEPIDAPADFHFRDLDPGARSSERGPQAVEQHRTPAMEALVRELAGQPFERVLIQSIYMAQYREFFRCPVFLEEHNVESELFQQHAALASAPNERVLWRAAAMQMRAYEQLHWPLFPLRFVVSELDRERMVRRCCEGRVVVIPNGADVTRPVRALRPDARRVLFTGWLAYRPNQQAVMALLDEVMPRVWEHAPDVRVLVAGADCPTDLRSRVTDPRVELVFDAPDLEPLVDGCSVLAVPLQQGSGTRIKILESWAWGLPVVSTPVGCEGLDGVDGRDLLIREDLAKGVLEVLGDSSLWERMRCNGRRLVEQRYDWNRVFAEQERELA
jgi:glycosyltransferase involved in cell wall biosynthesis